MRKTATRRFCGDCGYEFGRDRDAPCPMCARFEQLRIEFAAPRSGELAGGPPPRAGSPPGVSDPTAVDRWPTPSEYRAILAAQRARRASAEDRAEYPATVIQPSLRQPTKGLVQAPSVADEPKAPSRDASVAPKKRTPRRRKDLRNVPPIQEDAGSVSATEKGEFGEDKIELPVVDAHLNAQAREREQPASDLEYPWQTALWVILVGALVGASVPIISLFIR